MVNSSNDSVFLESSLYSYWMKKIIQFLLIFLSNFSNECFIFLFQGSVNADLRKFREEVKLIEKVIVHMARSL